MRSLLKPLGLSQPLTTQPLGLSLSASRALHKSFVAVVVSPLLWCLCHAASSVPLSYMPEFLSLVLSLCPLSFVPENLYLQFLTSKPDTKDLYVVTKSIIKHFLYPNYIVNTKFLSLAKVLSQSYTKGTHGGMWRRKKFDLDGTKDDKDFPWWCLDSVLNNRYLASRENVK